jgi:hypothetical protein
MNKESRVTVVVKVEQLGGVIVTVNDEKCFFGDFKIE